MERTLTSRQSVFLSFATVAALAATVAALGSVGDGALSLVTWCRNFVVAASARRGAVAVAVTCALAALAALSLLKLATFAATEWLTVRRFAAMVRRRRMRQPSRVSAARRSAGIRAPVLTVRDAIPFAVAVGIVSPRIVISSSLVSALTLAELRAVLAHEDGHCRERHPLRALLWESLRRTFFFLPTVADIAAHFSVSREIAADRNALGTCGQRPLASALLKSVASRTDFLPSTAPAFGHLTARISALAGKKGTDIRLSARHTAITSLAAVAIAALQFALTSTGALAVVDDDTKQCPSGPTANMSQINFSPYFSVWVPQMSPVPVDTIDKIMSPEPVHSKTVRP